MASGLKKDGYKFQLHDRIEDHTFDPPMNGVVVAFHHKVGAYYVHIDGAVNDVIVNERNLKERK
jgi:hypothetical protein